MLVRWVWRGAARSGTERRVGCGAVQRGAALSAALGCGAVRHWRCGGCGTGAVGATRSRADDLRTHYARSRLPAPWRNEPSPWRPGAAARWPWASVLGTRPTSRRTAYGTLIALRRALGAAPPIAPHTAGCAQPRSDDPTP